VPETEVAWVAALVAGTIGYVLGALWYSPFVLGRPWQRYMGWGSLSAADIKARQKAAAPAYGASFVAWIVMAVVLSIVIDWAGVESWIGGAGVAALAWIGFVATVTLTANLFHHRPLGLFLVDGGYQLLSLMVMGAIIAAWPW
jgi:hypothetical protein